jgi:hypothetical protein
MKDVWYTAMRFVITAALFASVAAARSPGDPLTLIRIVRHYDARDPIRPYQAVKPSVTPNLNDSELQVA